MCLSFKLIFGAIKKSQVNGFMFNIITLTAFPAKFVGLMFICHFEQPFSSLEDFAILRTHILCVSERLTPMKYFTKYAVSLNKYSMMSIILIYHFARFIRNLMILIMLMIWTLNGEVY